MLVGPAPSWLLRLSGVVEMGLPWGSSARGTPRGAATWSPWLGWPCEMTISVHMQRRLEFVNLGRISFLIWENWLFYLNPVLPIVSSFFIHGCFDHFRLSQHFRFSRSIVAIPTSGSGTCLDMSLPVLTILLLEWCSRGYQELATGVWCVTSSSVCTGNVVELWLMHMSRPRIKKSLS